MYLKNLTSELNTIATAASWSKENGAYAVIDHHWNSRSQHVAETSKEWIILNSIL